MGFFDWLKAHRGSKASPQYGKERRKAEDEEEEEIEELLAIDII